MKTIYINTSDVSSFIGQNQWDIVTPFERLWKRYETFIVPESVKETATSSEKTNISTVFATKEEKVEKYINLGDIKEITENKEFCITKQKVLVNNLVDKIQNITPDQRMEIRKNTTSIVNTSYGTLNELSVLEQVEDTIKKTLDKTQTLYNKSIDFQDFGVEDDKVYNYKICGKIDGNDVENKIIVEVKNRVKGFFKELRDYEKTQIHVYMWLLDYNEALLTERFNGKCKSTAVYFDNEYFSSIMNDLCRFLKKMQEFIGNQDSKVKYIVMNTREKTFFIESFFME
jgi:hypothetical protein